MRLLLFLSLGPLALAAFSRYATIIRQINRMTERLSLSLATVTSALVAGGAEHEVPRLYIQSTRLAVMISFPLLVVFAVCGDLIVTLWMGPEFVIDHVAVLLATGALLHANYAISYRLLSGLNAHGRIGLFSIFLSGLAILAALLTFSSFTAVNAAFVVAIVLLVTVHLPHISFMLLKAGGSPGHMLMDIYTKPLLLNSLFLVALLVCREMADSGSYYYVPVVLATMAGMLLIWSSWRYALDAQMKSKIVAFVRPGADSHPGVN
jgi:O-antigen/teichoic acid export membrane protein